MDLKSLLGYSQNSPFKNDKKILIKGNNITMHNTAIPLWLQGMKNGKKVGKKIKANPFDTNPYIIPGADSVEETPMFQKGGRKPIITNNLNDPRLKAYNDSLNLYKAYQFQKSNANRWPMLEEYAKNLTKMGHPTTAKELDATRQKNMGKIGKTSKLERSYNYNSFKKNPTQGYDPIDPKLGDKKIYDYYKSLKFNEPVAIGKYSSPDIIHSKIRPIGEYFDGVASSPVYKKPVQPIVYNQDIYLTPPNNKKPVQPVVYQKPLNSVFDDKSYDKKYPPKYTTNPKDPRIGMFDEAGNRWIYKKPPEPQEPVFKKPSSIQRTQTGDVNINTQRPSLKQNVELPEAFDYRKPSPFSFTYPTGPYNEQESVYFPDEKMLRSFAEGQNTTSIQSSGKGTTATGNLKQYQIGGIQDYLNSKSNSDWEVVENNFQPGGTKMNVDSILNSNKNLDWVKRLYENNPASVQLPNEKYPSTHLLEQADNRVYPRLQMVNGKLTDLGNNAYNYADSTKSYIQFANDAEALKFTQNYKSGKGVLKSFQLGGTKTDFPTPLINQKYAPGRVSDIGLRAPLPIDLNKDVEKVKENKKAANYQKLKSVGYTDKEAKALAQHTKLLPSAQDRINNLDIRNSRISKHPDYDPNKSFDEQVNLNSDNSLRTMILRGRNEFMSAKGVPILGDAAKMLVSPGSSFANMTMDAENRYVKPGVKQGLMNFGLDALDVFPTATGEVASKLLNKSKNVFGITKKVVPKSTTIVDDAINVNHRSVNDITKNLEDLEYTKEWGKEFGYQLPDNLERIASSNMLTDRTVKGLVNRHNTFARGVSTNWDELGKRNPEILRHLEGKGFNLSTEEGSRKAAEYMGTHVPIQTGYGRASLDKRVFDRGMDGLYTSNSIPTAEGYTYGDGYIVKAKKSTDFSSINRKDWVDKNRLSYRDEDHYRNLTYPLSENGYNVIKMSENADEAILKLEEQINRRIGDRIQNKNNPNFHIEGNYTQLEQAKNDLKYIKENRELFENSDYKILRTERAKKISTDNIFTFNENLNKFINSKGKNVNSSLKGTLEGEKLYQDIINIQRNSPGDNKAILNYLKENHPDFTLEDRYAHYIHLGTPGQKVLEPISSKKITPEIWKNKSRAHTNTYTKGLTAGALAPIAVGVAASQQETPKKGFKNGGRIESDWEIIN